MYFLIVQKNGSGQKCHVIAKTKTEDQLKKKYIEFVDRDVNLEYNIWVTKSITYGEQLTMLDGNLASF